jgi:hypothetical protein
MNKKSHASPVIGGTGKKISLQMGVDKAQGDMQ